MEPKDIEREAYRTAKKRVEERLGFFWHLITYVAVNIALVLIWYFGSGKGTHFWPIWPIIGWGVGLFFHFVGVFFEQSLFRKYKDKKIEQYMQEEREHIERQSR